MKRTQPSSLNHHSITLVPNPQCYKKTVENIPHELRCKKVPSRIRANEVQKYIQRVINTTQKVGFIQERRLSLTFENQSTRFAVSTSRDVEKTFGKIRHPPVLTNLSSIGIRRDTLWSGKGGPQTPAVDITLGGGEGLSTLLLPRVGRWGHLLCPPLWGGVQLAKKDRRASRLQSKS